MPIFFDVRGFSQLYSKNDMPFHIHQVDETADPRYYGYVSHISSWIIIQENRATGATRYVVGKQNFSTNWTNRAALSYDYINNL